MDNQDAKQIKFYALVEEFVSEGYEFDDAVALAYHEITKEEAV